MELKLIEERLEYCKNYIGYLAHCKVNNAMGGNMNILTFDQCLYSKHMDEYLFSDAMIVPLMIDPLGKYWDQCDNRHVYIDKDTATLELDDFKKLHEYSSSIPTGVYEGKMWKANIQGKWYLRWYSKSSDPKMCKINHREIKILPLRNYRYENDGKRTLTIIN